MPFRLPFNFPFFYNNYGRPQRPLHIQPIYDTNLQIESAEKKKVDSKKNSENLESSESFFEIFGLKLYFDDILIICILFFLYTEKVQDEELFICLILLLIS